MTGIIFDIQRGCMHDGPGLRTTVFLKGCNLRCRWCHNPESFSMKPQLQYKPERCAGCGACAAVCPSGVHGFDDGVHRVDFNRCQACGRCVEQCNTHALRLIGRQYTCEEVMEEIQRDAPYFAVSGGGVTFSGGEPTVQLDFLVELAMRCKQRGWHTAVETNGLWPEQAGEKLLPWLDLILLDFKIEDTGAHAVHTGRGREGWLSCLEQLEKAEKPVYLRCPVIPGINDTPAFLEEAARLYGQFVCIRHVELMPYHTIGVSKWASLGLDYSLAHLFPLPPERKREMDAQLQRLCGPWRD